MPTDGRAGGVADGGEGPEEATKSKVLADRLRELILSGEWRHGHVLPSQRELELEYGMSTVTVRTAVTVLAEEGLIEKSQGRRSRVSNREPSHRLVIRLHEPVDGSGRARVAEPPIAFAQDPRARAVRRRWSEREAAVPRMFAGLLGLRPGDPMVERVLTLTADDEPVLTSTSYLPPDLVGSVDDAPGWQDVEVGQLALVGCQVIADFLEERTRMPTPTELHALGMARGVSVKVLSRPCQVLLGDRAVRAGVIVLAPSDRVFLRWGADPPG